MTKLKEFVVTKNALPARFFRELKATLLLAFPIMGGQLAQTANGFVDTVMAGYVSPTDLASVAMGSSIWLPVFLLITGVLMATSAHVAQLAGAKKENQITHTIHHAFWLALVIGFIGFFAVRESPILLPLLNVEPGLWPITSQYLAAIAWGVPAVPFYVVLRCFCEGLSHTRPMMITSVIGLVCNIPLNYILIYGKLGLPAMGGVGCGWATAIVMWLMLALMILIVSTRKPFRDFNIFKHLRLPAITPIMELLHTGLPMGISIFFEVSIFSCIALLIGSLGVEVVAAHQIALNFTTLIFMLPLSISIALTVRVGMAVGQNNMAAAKIACQTGLIFSVCLAIVTALFIIITRPYITAIYTSDADIRLLAADLLLFAALFQLSDGIQVTANGALRGFKDTAIPMIYTLIAYWVIGLPIGYLLALTDVLIAPIGAKGFWIGLVLGLTTAAILLSYRLFHAFGDKRYRYLSSINK